MKKIALSEIKDDLSRYLRLATREDVVITRHGKPAGVLIGFENPKTTGSTFGLKTTPGSTNGLLKPEKASEPDEEFAWKIARDDAKFASP